jgi:hypothetical protein
MPARCLVSLAVVASLSMAQTARPRPLAVLEPAARLSFPSATDSNSPAFWRTSRGVTTLNVLNSTGAPVLSSGKDLETMARLSNATINRAVRGGWWMEAVVPDFRQVLYGYYHNEQPDLCPGDARSAPRIGAAKSFDGGRSWIDLGVILEAPAGSTDCQSTNHYFVGGVGDCSAILDAQRQWLYIFFSAYPRNVEKQGVAVARLRWSDRDTPAGRVSVWDSGIWRYPVPADDGTLAYEAATPIYRADRSFHTKNVGGFWGPSVHWNTFLKEYVMLLNRARDGEFAQEGIYVSSSPSLDEPAKWSPPLRVMSGGRWYPQVLGLEAESGTDKLAGERARLFVSGTSTYEIVFQQPDNVAILRR